MPNQTMKRLPRRPSLCLATLGLLCLFGCKDPSPSELPEPLDPDPSVALESETKTASTATTPTVDDASITRAVTGELLSDGLAPNYAIAVAANDGVVELTGEVDNLYAKQRANLISQAIKGVRSVSNRIAVVAEDIPDARLVDDIEAALLFDAATESYELEVQAKDGAVTLTGEVQSWAESQLAEQVAASVRGVESIDNQIHVAYGDIERPDIEIQREVEALLARDVLIDERGIEVRVDDGVVELHGTVGSVRERTMAHARSWTRGVDEVRFAELAVDWRRDDPALRDSEVQLRSASEIRAAIEDAALHDPRVLSFEIHASVEGGVVTLHGVVDNLEAKRAAEQLARNTVGVILVKNRIVVEDETPREDEEIARGISARLLTNLFTELREIDIDVDEGVVTLTGTVDSYHEKAEATSMAARTRGVLYVHNLLQVRDPSRGYLSSPLLHPFGPYVEQVETYLPAQADADDQALEAEVSDELFWSPYVDEDRVRVDVVDGKAILTGTVDTWRQREEATRQAYQAGALGVENLLHVDL